MARLCGQAVRAGAVIALQHPQYPCFNLRDASLLRRQARAEEPSERAVTVGMLQPCRCTVRGLRVITDENQSEAPVGIGRGFLRM